MSYPTSSKLWLSALCNGWHTLETPEVQKSDEDAGGAANFGRYMHAVAENEVLRRYWPERLTVIESKMTAEQEAVFNPYYTEEIGAPMDAESWGGSVVAIQDELFKLLPPNSTSIDVELVVVNYGPEFAMSKAIHHIKSREYEKSEIQGSFGTLDLMYVSGTNLVVIDWKTGREHVSADNNPQLIHIAKAGLELAKARGWHVDCVYVGIGDIRNQDLRLAKMSPDEVREKWKAIAKNILSTTKLTPGVHCDRCPKAGNCPAIAKAVETAAHDLIHGNTVILNPDKMAEVAIMARKLNKDYRDMLIHLAETDSKFKCRYLTKSPNGWRLSAFGAKNE